MNCIESFTMAQVTAEMEQWEYTLTFSMLEIYNETIRDLLDSNPAKEKLDVRQTPEGNVVPGLTEVVVSELNEDSDALVYRHFGTS